MTIEEAANHGHGNVKDLRAYTTAEDAVARITEIYKDHTDTIRQALNHLTTAQEGEDGEDLALIEQATYPYVGLRVESGDLHVDPSRAYGMVSEVGTYGTTVTRPDIFAGYWHEQLDLLIKQHRVPILVGKSNWSIPMPFVVEQLTTQLDPEQLLHVQNSFVLPNLSLINDSIANCTFQRHPNHPYPLALFSGERIDYSLHRLYHYTGTLAEHFQGFILLTNYQRYIDEFIEFSKIQLQQPNSDYTALVGPGNHIIANPRFGKSIEGEKLKYLPQMPAYHLKRQDGKGITFINIGIGPTNAKNITDHLAVLRPHCWLMLGHCAGLRRSQTLGDYIVAHGYVREDHVLDHDLPVSIPVPPIAEVQVALQQAVAKVLSQSSKADLKTHVRTGTVVTTDNRNWELQTQELSKRFRQSRAIALDMESATIATNGFRFRVPYGTLLCVSDKPLHGEIKLRGMANNFYQERITQHLKIGLETVNLLRESGDQLHSRKLRGFDEPPFR